MIGRLRLWMWHGRFARVWRGRSAHATWRSLACPVVPALVMLLAAGGCGKGRPGARAIKLGHGLDPAHPVHQAMVFMGQRLEQISGGRMRLDVYPSGQLGSERELIELLQIGSLGMTKVSSAVLEAFAPEYQVFSMPYLFRDDAHRWEVLDGPIGEELLLAGQSKRLRGLCYYDAGSRSFYTKTRPVGSPDDLRGMKIRVQPSPSAVRLMACLGASATPIAWGELYTALQQGVVDGAENNLPSFHLSRHYETCRYLSLDEHTAVPDVVLVSKHVWDSLAPREQAWLKQAARDSEARQRELWQAACDDALAKVSAAGVQVTRPDKDAFRARVRPFYDDAAGKPELAGLVARIRAAGTRASSSASAPAGGQGAP